MSAKPEQGHELQDKPAKPTYEEAMYDMAEVIERTTRVLERITDTLERTPTRVKKPDGSELDLSDLKPKDHGVK